MARWPVGAEPNEHQWKRFAVRNHRYRLVGDKLFDMIEDPGQEKDIAADNPEVVKKMRAAFDAFWKETRPLMVNEGVPMSKTRPYHVAYYKQEKEEGIPKWKAPKL